MKKLWTIVLLTALTANTFAQSSARNIDFSGLEETITAELKEKNGAGAAVAIVSGDKIVFAKGFGVANIETDAPVTPDSLFQIGSVTKTFTALAVIGFALDNQVKLHKPIENYAKSLSPKLGKVNLIQLLSHTAGIIDEPDEYGGQDESLMADYIRSWKDDYVLLDAGESFSYSNSGYALAGFVMQEAGGKPYVDLMRERVFQPLGMTRTTFRPTVAMTYPLAVGHNNRGEKITVVRPLANDARLYPAGTAYSSADELARFAVAFLNEGKIDGKQVISPYIIKIMSTPQAKQLSSANEINYGFGLFMNNQRGVRKVWHEGSMTGYSAMMLLAPEHRFAVITLSNTNGVQLNKTHEKAMELLLPPSPKEKANLKKSFTISETEMKNYVGVYSQPKRWNIEVLAKDNRLFIKQFNREMLLTKIGENRFSFQFPAPNITQEIFFKTGKDGKPTSLHQYVWAFKRIDASK